MVFYFTNLSLLDCLCNRKETALYCYYHCCKFNLCCFNSIMAQLHITRRSVKHLSINLANVTKFRGVVGEGSNKKNLLTHTTHLFPLSKPSACQSQICPLHRLFLHSCTENTCRYIAYLRYEPGGMLTGPGKGKLATRQLVWHFHI